MVEIEQMIYAHKDKLYRLCLYLEKNTYKAEELYQDTWVKALEKFTSYNPSYPFYPWLTRIAVNTYRDKLRRFKLEIKKYTSITREAFDELAGTQESLEKECLNKEKISITIKCIEKLPDKYKIPLLLIASEEITYKEAAMILKTDESLLKSRLYQGRQKLKTLLMKEGLDD